MDVEPVKSKAKAVALGLLVACCGWGSTALAAGATPQGAATQGSHGAQVAPMDASDDSGYELDYFHAYKASKTYAIRLKNGVSASFDFEHGTATVSDGTTSTTFPLEDVLLEASNGDVDVASQMFDQVYQDISAAHSDMISTYTGPGGYGTHGIFDPPRWDDGIGGLNDPLWGMPGQGDCWPIPFPCHEWSGGLSDWGAYNQWWNSPFGDPPPTPQPPNPNGCAPNDLDCRSWEHDREDACDELIWDDLQTVGAFGVAAAACVGTSGLGCAAGIFVYAVASARGISDSKQCHTPYPG